MRSLHIQDSMFLPNIIIRTGTLNVPYLVGMNSGTQSCYQKKQSFMILNLFIFKLGFSY